MLVALPLLMGLASLAAHCDVHSGTRHPACRAPLRNANLGTLKDILKLKLPRTSEPSHIDANCIQITYKLYANISFISSVLLLL